jgi:hypothetical protein
MQGFYVSIKGAKLFGRLHTPRKGKSSMVSADASSQGEYELAFTDHTLGAPTAGTTNDSINQGSFGFLHGGNVNAYSASEMDSFQQVMGSHDLLLPPFQEATLNNMTTNINNVNINNTINNNINNNINHYNVINVNYPINHPDINSVNIFGANTNENSGLTRSGSVKRKQRVTPLSNDAIEANRVTNCLNAEKHRVKKALRLSVAEDKNAVYEKQGYIKDQRINDLELTLKGNRELIEDLRTIVQRLRNGDAI